MSKEISDNEALNPLSQDLIGKLVENHAEFKKFLSKRLPSEAVVEDILQQGLARAFEKQSSIKNEENIVSWFYTLLKNAVIDYYRAHASDADKSENYLKELSIFGNHQVKSIDHLETAVCACIHRLLPTLRTDYANLLKRIDLDGESIRNIASECGETPNNLTVRLHRARQALKKSLERSCGSCTEHGCLNCTCE